MKKLLSSIPILLLAIMFGYSANATTATKCKAKDNNSPQARAWTQAVPIHDLVLNDEADIPPAALPEDAPALPDPKKVPAVAVNNEQINIHARGVTKQDDWPAVSNATGTMTTAAKVTGSPNDGVNSNFNVMDLAAVDESPGQSTIIVTNCMTAEASPGAEMPV